MATIREDLSIFSKFNFEIQPVAINYLFMRPDGLNRINAKFAFCEMLREAHNGKPFYATKEDFECIGPLLLGMEPPDPIFESGQMGPRLGYFKEERANRRIYQVIPRLAQGTVNYVSFSPSNQVTIDPDIVVITANTSQAEIILRAYSYSTGQMWSTKGTPVMSCAWLFVYPYISGQLNFAPTGLGSGMKARRVLPEGLIMITIPFDLLPMISRNLKDMDWVLESYTESRDKHTARFNEETEKIRRKMAQ
jgi:uncharacterized protein (DUF169 family)